MTFSLADLALPIVQAPMAGGPSTVELAAAVCEAGGLGMVAGAGLSAQRLGEEIVLLRAATTAPFGVNLFSAPSPAVAPEVVEHYAASLAGEEGPLGEPRHDDDELHEKLALMVELRPPVVSFTFGCPHEPTVDRLRASGCAVWVTVTTPREAVYAAGVGADALIVQGVEAGGHRGSFDDVEPGDIGLLALLQLVAARTDLPLIAAGGIVTGRAIAGVLAAGASAAQLGTALMRTPEAGTPAEHRELMAEGMRPTGLTRAYSGRTARGIVNRFQQSHADAPSAYPQVNHLTAPLRAAARAAGDAEAFNLWAGQAYPLASDRPAGELVTELANEARERLSEVAKMVEKPR
ncbi:MAG: 2-nitropropane dioxygenase [Solirubrobacterales bacterium]|jgi:nitronate monooxygenase|nr:2-nitropropane dioxygenase [Solirubrobacterales bacterium]